MNASYIGESTFFTGNIKEIFFSKVNLEIEGYYTEISSINELNDVVERALFKYNE